jgi:methionyl-tRNA formyltransferase
MRIVFCGTPEFAVPSLKHLLDLPEFQVIAAISQPDRPRGRGQQIAPTPVKQAAQAADVPVHQPESLRSDKAFELIAGLQPDAIVIIAYGQIVPERLLSVPRLGWINLHAALLPKYRGAAPIHWAIANGETQTGLTTMRIDAGMDTGGILLQRAMAIGPSETAPQLSARMAAEGAPLVTDTLRGLAAGTIAPRAQDHSAATAAPVLKKEDGRIHWNRSAGEIYNRIRGFAAWPGAYTAFRGQLCHVWGAPLANTQTTPVAPGSILQEGAEVLAGCGGGTLLRLDGVKLEGRKRITAREFANGVRLRAGEIFESAE